MPLRIALTIFVVTAGLAVASIHLIGTRWGWLMPVTMTLYTLATIGVLATLIWWLPEHL